jgi:hypothetical protein
VQGLVTIWQQFGPKRAVKAPVRKGVPGLGVDMQFLGTPFYCPKIGDMEGLNGKEKFDLRQNPLLECFRCSRRIYLTMEL